MTAVLFFALLSSPQLSAAAPAGESSQVATKADAEIDALRQKLKVVRRIYVDSFGDDAVAKQIQAMVISSLAETKRFVITENKEKADAVLKGMAVEKTSQEFHSNSEGTAAGSAGGSRSGFGAAAMAVRDASASTETIDNARLAVRLVTTDGDVIWATTQESRGAKYKGSSADVAEKIVKRLLRDVEKTDEKVTSTEVKPSSPAAK